MRIIRQLSVFFIVPLSILMTNYLNASGIYSEKFKVWIVEGSEGAPIRVKANGQTFHRDHFNCTQFYKDEFFATPDISHIKTQVLNLETVDLILPILRESDGKWKLYEPLNRVLNVRNLLKSIKEEQAKTAKPRKKLRNSLQFVTAPTLEDTPNLGKKVQEISDAEVQMIMQSSLKKQTVLGTLRFSLEQAKEFVKSTFLLSRFQVNLIPELGATDKVVPSSTSSGPAEEDDDTHSSSPVSSSSSETAHKKHKKQKKRRKKKRPSKQRRASSSEPARVTSALHVTPLYIGPPPEENTSTLGDFPENPLSLNLVSKNKDG